MADEGRITVTIKYGKGFDDSWVVFRGSAETVQQDIVDFFGLDGKSVAGLAPSELVVEATRTAQATTTIVKGLDARIIPAPAVAAAPKPPASTAEAPGGLLEQIAQCASTDDLKRLWATNQAAFSDSSVMDAWKARGRALKAAV
ncbi:hypothetical protein AB0D63_20770 [Kitasatospora sp. NPDC048343]|uniref:hypothetical protein n=1 Tax=Kitasatospora sp. NPDC048343 TaxID=3154717 RepID=UPI00340E2674